LENLLNEIGEKPDRRSEPDVVLDFGPAGLAIIEVKLWSKNESKKSDYDGWDKYTASTEAFLSHNGARSSGLYELVRNWRIGCQLAENRPFVLINLGPASLFKNVFSDSMSRFCESIPQGPMRRFMKVTWQQFLGGISKQPEWFRAYVQDRGLV
jgi:hypothetical protein